MVKHLSLNFCSLLKNYLKTIPVMLFYLSFVMFLLTMQSFAGLIISFFLAQYLRYLAEQARQKALAGSSVKVVGIDVMASKKITTTIMLYPFILAGFELFLYYVLTST